MVLENMKCNLKNEKMCQDYAHGTLVLFAFAQINSVVTSRSIGAVLSICYVVMALLRASPTAPTVRSVR
jgi:hypothetical protein